MESSASPPPHPNQDIIPADQNAVNDLGPTYQVDINQQGDLNTLQKSVYDTAYKAARKMWEGEQKDSQIAELEEKLETDPLTGLSRKNGWLKAANKRLEAAEPTEMFGALFIDLRNFKAINDLHPGKHTKGDQVLVEVANILRRSVRDVGQKEDFATRGNRKDTSGTARLGGDEFAVFADLNGRANLKLTPEERLAAFQARLQTIFDDYLSTNSDLKSLGFGLSVGAVLRQPSETAEQLLERADQAMYTHKEQQKRDGNSYRD